MNIEHLELDEFELECLVRSIEDPSIDEKLTNLKLRLELEQEHSCLIPNKPHLLARKNPKREISNVASKIKEIYDCLQEAMQNDDQDDLLKLKSRLLHVKDRLIRLNKSKAVAITAVIQTLDKVNQLLRFVDESVGANEPLNQSITKLQVIDIISEDDCDSEVESITNADSVKTESVPRSSLMNNMLPTQLLPTKSSSSANPPISRSEYKPQPINFCERQSKSTIPTLNDNPIQNGNPMINQLSALPQSNILNYSSPPMYKGGRSLSKWNIHFDGTHTGIHIKRFLVRVEHLARSENISDIRLVNELHYILRGTASECY